MGLVPRLHLGDGLYAANTLVKNRGGSAYIKIIKMRDTDEKIVVPEVELEELDKIATNRLKNSKSSLRQIQTHFMQPIIFRVHEVGPYGNFYVWITLTKRKQSIDRIINKYSD